MRYLLNLTNFEYIFAVRIFLLNGSVKNSVLMLNLINLILTMRPVY